MALPKRTRKKTIRARARTGVAAAPTTNWIAFSSYFHLEVDKKDYASITKDWIKQNYSKSDAKAILANPEWNFTSYSHVAAAIAWIGLGNDWSEYDDRYQGYATCAKKKFDPLIESGKEILAKKAKDQDIKNNVIVLTPQQKLARKVNQTILMELDDVEDKWIEGDYGATIDLYQRFKAHGLTGAAVDQVRKQVEAWHLDYSDAYHKRCDQAVEGYSHMTRPQQRKVMKTCEQWLMDLEKIKATAKVTRKPRAPKVRTADKQVAKLNYLKEDKTFKLESVNPTVIPGAMRLYTFNVKSKDFTELVSDSPNGFEVSGSTLKKVDLEASRKIKLRKPDEFLPKALSGTVKQIDSAWKSLTTKTSTPNARINKDTILLKVSAK